MRDSLRRDVLFAEMSESLDYEAAEAPSGSHVARRCPPKLDRHRAQPYESARSVGQEHNFHGHLLGQAEEVRRVCSGGLKPSPVAPGKGFSDDLGGWLQLSKGAVLLRVQVHASSQSPEGTRFGQPGEGLVNCRPASEVHEVRWRERRSSTSTSDPS
jgi:hypothetical protein